MTDKQPRLFGVFVFTRFTFRYLDDDVAQLIYIKTDEKEALQAGKDYAELQLAKLKCIHSQQSKFMTDSVPPTPSQQAKYIQIRALLEKIVNSPCFTPKQIKTALNAESSDRICIFMDFTDLDKTRDELRKYNEHLNNMDRVLTSGPCIGVFLKIAQPMLVYKTPESLAKMQRVFEGGLFEAPYTKLLNYHQGILWCFEVIYNEEHDCNRFFILKEMAAAPKKDDVKIPPMIDQQRAAYRKFLAESSKFHTTMPKRKTPAQSPPFRRLKLNSRTLKLHSRRCPKHTVMLIWKCLGQITHEKLIWIRWMIRKHKPSILNLKAYFKSTNFTCPRNSRVQKNRDFWACWFTLWLLLFTGNRREWFHHDISSHKSIAFPHSSSCTLFTKAILQSARIISLLAAP